MTRSQSKRHHDDALAVPAGKRMKCEIINSFKRLKQQHLRHNSKHVEAVWILPHVMEQIKQYMGPPKWFLRAKFAIEYFFIRSGRHHVKIHETTCEDFSTEEAFEQRTVHQMYKGVVSPEWRKAYQDNEGNWVRCPHMHRYSNTCQQQCCQVGLTAFMREMRAATIRMYRGIATCLANELPFCMPDRNCLENPSIHTLPIFRDIAYRSAVFYHLGVSEQ